MKNYNKELELIKNAVPELLKNNDLYSFASIDDKTQFDLVTNVDKSVEQELIKIIKANYPNDYIIAEESLPEELVNKRTWTIDPIDGTVNMANGIKLFGTQVSLMDEGVPVMSYIYFPNFHDEYYALKDQGAYYNGKKIQLTEKKEFSKSLISFGDYSHNNIQMAKLQHKAIGILYPMVSKIRMFGSAALDFSLAARGATQGCIVITKNLWDIMPGIHLCMESGLYVKGLDGNDFSFNSEGVIIASTKELLELIVRAFDDNEK